MKRCNKIIVCILVAIILMFNATCSYATELDNTYSFYTETIAPENVAVYSPDIVPYGFGRLEFAGFNREVVVIADQDVIVTSSYPYATLDIISCVWAPEYYDVDVGFYCMDTGEFRHTTVPNDAQDYAPITFNLQPGTYRVAARNMGSSRLTTGYMSYNTN